MSKNNYLIFITTDSLGTGDRELGRKLMSSYIYSVLQVENLPTHILFINSGVNLVTSDSDLLDELRELENKGVKILACGTCLDYYSLKEDVAVGDVTNMHLTVELMAEAGKVITIS